MFCTNPYRMPSEHLENMAWAVLDHFCGYFFLNNFLKLQAGFRSLPLYGWTQATFNYLLLWSKKKKEGRTTLKQHQGE